MTSVLPAAQHRSSVAPNVPETAARKLHDQLNQGKKILIIDVRSEKEYFEGHVPGAINIPMESLREKLAEMKVAKTAPIITVCEHGGRSSHAVQILRKLGYQASSFCRLDAWKKEEYFIETGPRVRADIPKIYRFYCQHGCLTYVETADLDQVCTQCDCGHCFRKCMKGD